MRPQLLLLLPLAVLGVTALAPAAARPALAAPPPDGAATATVAAAKAALQAGVDRGQPAGILDARARFVALSAAEPDAPALHYWVALATWRAVPLMMKDAASKERAKKLCRDGIERCDRVLAKAPRHADAIALKAGLQGLWLSFEPAAMMTLGMQMEEAMERARTLEPENPRVAFLDGVNTFHKPAFVGGGADKARARFDQAIALFARTGAAAGAADDPATLDWGRDDAYVWAGRAAAKTKDYAAAKAYYEKALGANPGNGWVRGTLLPGVEKQLAGQGDS